MPYKDFADGEILYASDVDTYLMRQTVMTFTNSSSRSSAIGTVSVEGMATYLTETNAMEVYNGSAWVSANSLGGTVAGSQVTGSITSATINNANVQNTLTSSASTSYTIASTDQGDILRFTAAGTVTATISTATAFTAGQRVDIVADGAAGVRVITGAGVTLAGGGAAGTAYTFGQYDAVSVLCVASNNYRIIGNITAV